MKKLLLCGVAALAITAAAPAKAEGIDLGLGGYFIGYGLYNNQDDGAASLRSFDFRKETEVHFTGETTLDNGLTVGGHIELNADRNLDAAANNEVSRVEESYMYVSGGWGRINFGEEDGAAYLLQVAAPSADENIDGLRPDINSFDLSAMSTGNFAVAGQDVLDYATDATGYANKLTYITPMFSGFQAGLSYTPSVTDGSAAASSDPFATDNNAGFDDAVDLAARYQGVFGATDVTLGAGWQKLGAEVAGAEDLTAWNAGARVGFGAFGVGASWVENDNGVATDGDTNIMVAGVDYTTGPFKVGVSYYDRTDEVNAPQATGTGEVDTTRLTAGVGYQYGPGMSLNGSVARVEVEDTATSGDGFQVAVGTRVDF